MKTWKNCTQKMLIISPNLFFQYCQPAQNQPKSHFLFHKKVSLRNFAAISVSIEIKFLESYVHIPKLKFQKDFEPIVDGCDKSASDIIWNRLIKIVQNCWTYDHTHRLPRTRNKNHWSILFAVWLFLLQYFENFRTC